MEALVSILICIVVSGALTFLAYIGYRGIKSAITFKFPFPKISRINFPRINFPKWSKAESENYDEYELETTIVNGESVSRLVPKKKKESNQDWSLPKTFLIVGGVVLAIGVVWFMYNNKWRLKK